MEFLQNKIIAILEHRRNTGLLQITYALGVEALLIGYLYFIGLFTIETLLPTFVTARVSLTKFFFLLVSVTIILAFLGKFLKISFSWSITRKSPLLWLSIFWAIGILTVSLMKFPPFLIPILIALLLLSGYLFWNIFFEEK